MVRFGELGKPLALGGVRKGATNSFSLVFLSWCYSRTGPPGKYFVVVIGL